jgi:hypothetical protein
LQIYFCHRLDGAMGYSNTYSVFMMFGGAVGAVANTSVIVGAVRNQQSRIMLWLVLYALGILVQVRVAQNQFTLLFCLLIWGGK